MAAPAPRMCSRNEWLWNALDPSATVAIGNRLHQVVSFPCIAPVGSSCRVNSWAAMKCSGQVEVPLDTRAKARARPQHYVIQELR
jgi:hypothetical protein